MNDKEAITGKGYGGGGKQSQNVQKTDDKKSLYWVAIALVALIAAGVLFALVCK